MRGFAVDGSPSHRRERGLEPGELLSGGAGPRVLVLLQQHGTAVIGHRDHRTVEAALGDGLGGAALALRRVRVDVGSGEAFERGDQIGRNTLRDSGVAAPEGGVVAVDGRHADADAPA